MKAYQDDTLDPSQRINHAVAAICERLINRGMRSEAAQELAVQARARLMVSGAGGAIRVAYPGQGVGYYPLDGNDPLDPIVHDLYYGAGDDAKGRTSAQEAREAQQSHAARVDAEHKASVMATLARTAF